jgi:Fic family protein
MKSFEKNFFVKQTLDHGLLQIIRQIGEHRGREQLFQAQVPQVLEGLRHVAVIQSTESSNRIEGVEIPSARRLQDLMAEKVNPANRSEQEIAGYRDVLNLIHSQHEGIELTSGVILQLHSRLFAYAVERGGEWKRSDNEIAEVLPTGEKRLRFKPVPSFQTQDYMDSLHAGLREANTSELIEPLLVLASYVLDFLCIHPFRDGNGRLSRLLSLLLLYRTGYSVGRYISLEKIIEETKEVYYEALGASSAGWHEGKHDLRPWWNYFLGVVLLGAYRQFEARVGQIEGARGTKAALILDAIQKSQGQFSVGELQAQCPTVGIDHIRKVLRQERDAGRLKCIGRGPDAKWEKCVTQQ